MATVSLYLDDDVLAAVARLAHKSGLTTEQMTSAMLVLAYAFAEPVSVVNNIDTKTAQQIFEPARKKAASQARKAMGRNR